MVLWGNSSLPPNGTLVDLAVFPGLTCVTVCPTHRHTPGLNYITTSVATATPSTVAVLAMQPDNTYKIISQYDDYIRLAVLP